MSPDKKPIFTVGHSSRSTKDFMKILEVYDVGVLVDVRRFPGSKTNPQFGKTRLKQSLKRHKIDYVHLEALGGRRRPDKESHENDGWRSPQFRGYADYMHTDEFKAAFDELVKIAKKKTVVIMCAEAVPWRCHRSLIADALLVHDFKVIEIFDEKIARPHKLTSFAEVHHHDITYPVHE